MQCVARLTHPTANKPNVTNYTLTHPTANKPNVTNRDVNGFIKNSLKMSGSRGRIGPGGVKGQRPCGGSRGAKPPFEKLNFHTITA